MARYASSQTPLGGGATWNSGEIQPEGGDNLVGLAFSDQTGTLNVDQSADGGANWDFTTTVAVTGGTGASFSVPIYGNRVRLRYVNGATPQTVFRVSARTSSTGPRG